MEVALSFWLCLCSGSAEIAQLKNFLSVNCEQPLKEWERISLKMNLLKTAKKTVTFKNAELLLILTQMPSEFSRS